MRLIYPLAGGPYPVTQSFAEHVARARSHGWCSGPGNCPSGIYYYGGIDYGCSVGTQVLATEGVVERAENQGERVGYGKHIRIRHPDGTLTIYAHLWEWHVAKGDKVVDGRVIGLSGNTGNSTGPHLHFEHRDAHGVPVNPDDYLSAFAEPKPEPEMPFEVIKAGNRVALRRGFDYVNIRPMPGTARTPVGRFLPGDQAEAVEVRSGWVCIFRLKGIELWVSSDYLEAV